jgi:hypothetical protein
MNSKDSLSGEPHHVSEFYLKSTNNSYQSEFSRSLMTESLESYGYFQVSSFPRHLDLKGKVDATVSLSYEFPYEYMCQSMFEYIIHYAE